MKENNYLNQSPVPLDDCGMAALAQILGDKWTLLIIRQVFYGVAKFEDMRAELGIPRAVLTGRLNRLLEVNVIKKVPYQQPGQRGRFAYELDGAGKALMPFLMEALNWGDTYLRQKPGAIELIEKGTGGIVTRKFVNENGQLVDDSQVRARIRKT